MRMLAEDELRDAVLLIFANKQVSFFHYLMEYILINSSLLIYDSFILSPGGFYYVFDYFHLC